MRRLACLSVIVLVAAACGGTSGDSTTTTTVASPSTTADAAPSTTAGVTTTAAEATTTTAAVTGSSGAQLVLTSVSFGASPFVVITNIGDETGSLAGHFLCQRPSYAGLPDVEVAAGEAIAFSLGGDDFTPPEGVTASEEVLELGGLSNTGGEMGLYTSSNFGSSDDIISYVEWGSGDHGRSATAVAAGIWGGFVPTSDSTLSLVAETLPALSSDDWGEG